MKSSTWKVVCYRIRGLFKKIRRTIGLEKLLNSDTYILCDNDWRTNSYRYISYLYLLANWTIEIVVYKLVGSVLIKNVELVFEHLIEIEEKTFARDSLYKVGSETFIETSETFDSPDLFETVWYITIFLISINNVLVVDIEIYILVLLDTGSYSVKRIKCCRSYEFTN